VFARDPYDKAVMGAADQPLMNADKAAERA
jgi:hypothetical protein